MSGNDLKILNKERQLFIDKACGFAMILVVYAHFWFPETIMIKWYLISKEVIYKFHMPLFMCISGYLAFLSTNNRRIKSTADYFNFQRKKIYKFLPVYIIAASCSILLDVFYKNLPVAEINQNIYNTFFIPASGSAVFIWYLYVLVGFYLVTPFLLNLNSSSQYLLLFFGFLLTNSSFSNVFSANLFCKYFFFFFSGGMIYIKRDQFILFLATYGKWITFLTLGILIMDLFIHLIIPYQLNSIGVIMSVLYISTLEWPGLVSKIFVKMGVSSFAIFILNAPIMDIYYFFFKSILKIPIGGVFVFSGLIIILIFSVLIRFIFNKVVPAKVYSL